VVANKISQDKSNGYEGVAQRFMSARDQFIGVANVRAWSKTLVPNSSILDLGCGHGLPISQTLIDEGFTIYGVDASPSLIAAFHKRVPSVHLECAAVEDSEFFGRTFGGVVAWGLMFLLTPDVQADLIHKVARVLTPRGKFLFTAPVEPASWVDILTGRESSSLGGDRYRQILQTEGMVLLGEQVDEAENHYYLASKP
jgi:SAM-dependent methyltransferase